MTENNGQVQIKPVRSRIKRIILVLVTTIIALFAVAIIAAWVLEDKIKAKIVAELNERIDAKIEIKGGINLSLFKHFPYASLTFNDVIINDKLRKGKKLAGVSEISLLCNIYSLFSDEVEFKRIVVRDGEINLYRDDAGRANYLILKEQKADTGKGMAIQLNKVEIKRIRLNYTDKTQASVFDVTVNQAALKGMFEEAAFVLDVSCKLSVKKASVQEEHFLEGKDLSAEVSINVDKVKKRYDFNKGKLAIGESEFAVNGFFASAKGGTQVDFKLTNEGKDLQQLVALFPEGIRQNMAGAEGTGAYSILATVKGTIGKSVLPAVNIAATLKDSQVKFGQYNKLLKEVNATATYELDAAGNDKLVISNFDCKLNEQPFHFKLSIDQLKNPSFSFFANGVLQLEELSAFVPDSVVQDIGGAITFTNFALSGRKSDFTDVENSTLTGSGKFALNGVEFRNNGITYGNIGGVLTYDKQVIEAQNFTLNFLSTDFSFTGTIQNLFAFAYNLSKKRSSNGVVLGVNGHVKAQTFNLSGILEAYNRKNRPQAQIREKINIREVLNMQGNLSVDIDRFIYNKMEFTEVRSSLQVAPGVIRINELTARAMQGDVKATGVVAFTTSNDLNMRCDIRAAGLSLPTIFQQCENFGQTALTDRHLKGTITTALSFDATWRNYKEFDPHALTAIVDFSIKDGELINFEPLRAASKFIRLEELEDIKFSELANTIKIANGRLDLPEFEIKSSALNLIIYGYHYFDNTVDYHFKINLHKLLAQKFRRRTDLQYMEDDPYEGVNIYLSMSGKINDPQIKLDKASTRNKIKEDFKKEKDVLKNLLNNNTPKVDENEKKREDKYFDVKEQPQFMDFEDNKEP
ncbi:MAG: AsmA-like C-terminal region-containing protein [Chitinophagales bacterium]